MKKYIFLLIISWFGFSGYAQTEVDFIHLQAEIQIDPDAKSVSGELLYTFDVNGPVDSIFIDARKMEFQKVAVNGKEATFMNDEQNLVLVGKFQESQNNQLHLAYTASPEQAMYFIPTTSPVDKQQFQVWTQGQGKYTSHWLPSFDDPGEKVEFDLSILYPKGKKVISNGKLTDIENVQDLVRWNYNMDKPMSSYLLAVAAGDFESNDFLSETGIPLQLYYPAGHGHFQEPTYRYTGKILNFLEKETGIDYPWQNYKQVPVRDFLYAGMENTGATLFSDLFLVDSIGFQDRNYVMVNAHEMAHQWFGNLVTAASGRHHWLQEGFATYYALLAEKEIFGTEYFYWKLYQSAEELKRLSDSGKGESLQDPKASSITFYQKGAWALHILKDLVGKQAFDSAVKNYLKKYAYGVVTTENFLSEVERSSGVDLSTYKSNWIEQSAFRSTEAYDHLKRSAFIQEYLKVAALKQVPIANKERVFRRLLNENVNDYVGQEIVHQLALEDPLSVDELYREAFKTGNLYVRQAIALSLQQIPQGLKANYESLLDDKSYVTQEAALFHLWINFPEEQLKYLEKMRARSGFLDKNIRTLWLALSIATPAVDQVKKEQYLEELSSYTAPHHRFQLRQRAFEYLFELRAFQSNNLDDLIDASKHFNYRFRGFAKEMIEKILETELLPEQRRILEKQLGLEHRVKKSDS